VARKPRRAAQRRTHSRATTTPGIRRAIQASEETNVALAKRHGVNRKTVAKWKAREFTSDERMGPKTPSAGILSPKDETIILAYRWRTRLALDDCHLRLRNLMPNLSRSTLYRRLKRSGLSRVGSTTTCPPLTTAALRGPYRFEIAVNDVVFRDPDDVLGVLYPVFLAVEEITKHVYAEVAEATAGKRGGVPSPLGRPITPKNHCGNYGYRPDIHRLESELRRRYGRGRTASLRRRLPRPRDPPQSIATASYGAPENPSPWLRNPISERSFQSLPRIT
jgi:hypothetical protein